MTEPYAVSFILQMKVMPPEGAAAWIEMIVRWIHFVAGITWIGLLYFFNLVNGQTMAKLDGPTKAKVIPELMPRALWYFRWGALVTVLAGLYYWAMIILRSEPPDAPGSRSMGTVGLWLVIVAIFWGLNFASIKIPAITKNGWAFAAVNAILILVMAYVMLRFLSYEGMSSRSMSIAIGGGMGTFMLLNVWGIIWRAQKRIIAWTVANARDGTAIPDESKVLARGAFLASRGNTWMSLPMLWLMGASSHFAMFVQ